MKNAIMKQFLASNAKDKVLTKWQILNMMPNEPIQMYEDKFWDLHLNYIVYKQINFAEQKQQFWAGLFKEVIPRK